MSVATIGSALAKKRTELGLDKGEAAERVGMSRTSYSSYEQDSQRPSVDVFPALAKFLSISIEDLLVLYGATCVAAARSSLGRTVADLSGDTASGPAESTVVSAARVRDETEVPEASKEVEPVRAVAVAKADEPLEPVDAPRSIQRQGDLPKEEPSASIESDPDAMTLTSSEHGPLEGSSPADAPNHDGAEFIVGNKKKKKKKKKKN